MAASTDFRDLSFSHICGVWLCRNINEENMGGAGIQKYIYMHENEAKLSFFYL